MKRWTNTNLGLSGTVQDQLCAAPTLAKEKSSVVAFNEEPQPMRSPRMRRRVDGSVWPTAT